MEFGGSISQRILRKSKREIEGLQWSLERLAGCWRVGVLEMTVGEEGEEVIPPPSEMNINCHNMCGSDVLARQQGVGNRRGLTWLARGSLFGG
jgi:hypothetical protein